MKWLIASDIHGSEYYCKEMIESFKRENADKILLLGDILYHGPRNDLPKDYNPKSVIELLNQLYDKIICVRGNCDSEVDQMVLKFPVLADYCILCIEDLIIYATHGHINDRLPHLSNGTVLLSGHTHVPVVTNKENYICANPGSVSIPKENSHHGYMILENSEFVWKEFEQNVMFSYKIK